MTLLSLSVHYIEGSNHYNSRISLHTLKVFCKGVFRYFNTSPGGCVKQMKTAVILSESESRMGNIQAVNRGGKGDNVTILNLIFHFGNFLPGHHISYLF